MAGFGVMNRVAQLFLRDALLAFAFFLDEASLFHDIARAEEQLTFTGQAIAPGPPRFLIITFDVLRQIVMNNKTDIWFVDPHSERNRRRNHARVVEPKTLLLVWSPVNLEAT